LDISGVIYGAQAGLNFEATDRLQIEAGYRYLKSNMSDSVGGVAFDIDELKNWFVGFNYKF
jgi:opacity protein-like surface antigen